MNSTLADTVLAWSQNELHIYCTLSLIQPLSDINTLDDKVIVCLAHRYFYVPHLIQQLQQPDREYLIQIFQERAAIDIQQNTIDWLHQLKLWTNEHRQEENMEFERHANQLLSRLLDLYHTYIEEHSVASSKKEDSLEDAESVFHILQTHELLEIESIDHPIVSAIGAVRSVIENHLQNGDRQTTQTIAHIRNELEFIQAKMLKTTTTDAGIQDLEERAEKAGELLEALPNLDEALSEKYKLVCAWVAEVRVWFVEADRIRSWIEKRIVILEDREAVDALEEVELEYAREQVEHLNKEHERLQKEVEAFDKHDMARLRAHVKALTGNNKDLSPADTTTIEITFTTLMTLDRLMHLLRRRSYELQILTLRMDWEHEYDSAVGWVRSKLEQVKQFIDDEARWRPTLCTEKNNVIDKLVEFEKECAIFDKAQFTTTVNAYQELDDSCHMELPSHLESRQVALEESFETLTNRIALARQVVEQYLVITDFLGKADELKSKGEQLRQVISQAEQQLQTNVDLNEKVSLFQEDAMRLMTGIASRIPYPEATHLSDLQANEDANETIRMVIGARKSALLLLGEALEQDLNAYRRAMLLQKRVKQLQDEINRLNGWVDERMRAMQKAKVDVFVGKCALDEVDLARLRKERDGQVSKLKGIRENDVKKLSDNIQSLPSMSAHHKSCIDTLESGLSELRQHMCKLDEALSSHSLGLDILEKRIGWEALYNKTLQWITNMTYNTWDFTAKKAQWRNKDYAESDWIQVLDEFKEIQEKMNNFEQQSFDSTQKAFCVLMEGFDLIENEDVPLTDDNNTMTPEHVKRRQDTLNRNFTHLKDLLLFTQAVLDQHVSLNVFSTHASTLYESGEEYLAQFQKYLQDVTYYQQDESLQQKVDDYAHQVLEIWTRMGSRIPYPQCNEEARATRFSTSDDEISTEIANTVYKTYADLQDLVNQIKDLFSRLKIALNQRKELNDYINSVDELTECLKQTKQESEDSYNFELFAETIQPFSQPLIAQTLDDKITELTNKRYEPLIKRHDELLNLGDESVDLSRLSQVQVLKNTHKDITEYVATYKCKSDCYNTRLKWESLIEEEKMQLNGLQERVRDTGNEKNFWLSLDNQQDELLEKIVKDALEQNQEIDRHCEGVFMALEDAYTKMVHSYEKLGETPTTVKTKQAEIIKRLNRMQEFIKAQDFEVKQIHDRYSWESSVDKKLKICDEFETEVNNYIKHHARWSTEASTCEPPRAEFLEHTETLEHLLNEFDTVKPTEATEKRKLMIESSKSRIELFMCLLDQVLAQTQVIRSRVADIDHLEARAESLKTQFLATDEGDFEDNFQAYREAVEQLDITLPLPGSGEHLVYNASMTDMIQGRYARLEELVGILASILKTKEQVSRRRAAEASYLAEVDTVKEWIQSKWAVPESQDLREAVQSAETTYSAVLAYSNSMNALRASSVKTMQVMEDDTLKSTQMQVDEEYNTLCEHVSQVKKDLSDKLRQAEWDQLLNDFDTTHDQLEKEMQMQVENITEQVVSNWQERVHRLDIQQVKPIQELAEMNPEAYERIQKSLQDIKSVMHHRSTEANQYRWKQRYLADADELEDLIQTTCRDIDSFQKEQGLMQENLVKKTKAAYEALSNIIENRVDKYDELCSSHRFLQLNKVMEVDSRQQEIETSWKQMQEKMTQAKQVVGQAAQWNALFDKIKIKDTLDTTVEKVAEETVDFDKEKAVLSQLMETIQTTLSAAKCLSDKTPTDTRMKENLSLFQKEYDPIHLEITKVQDELNRKEKLAQKESDIEACESMVLAVKESIQDQIELWKEDLEKIQQDPSVSTINKRSAIEIKQNELIRHTSQVIQPILTRLNDQFEVDIQPMQDTLDCAFEELSQAVKTDTDIRDLIRRSIGHTKSASDISSWIMHCQNAIEQIDPHDENSHEDMEILGEKIKQFKPVIKSFESMTADIHSLPVPDQESNIWNRLVSLVDKRAEEIKQKWKLIEQAKEQATQDVYRTNHGITMLRKIKNVMNLLGETRDCLENIRVPMAADIKSGQEDGLANMLRQPEIEAHLKTLAAAEKEMKHEIKSDLAELDKMAKECNEGDALIHQHQETKDAVGRLSEAIKEKEAELNRALELGKFLTITDDLNILQSSLEDVIGKPAPVTLMGHSMSRSDLQAKIIELDARYKYYENNIIKSLQTAKETPMVHYPEKRLITQNIKAAERRWELLKKQYKTRKVELGRTVDSKEYQQQQTRIRKSSLPNRRASPLLRPPGDTSSRIFPTPSASSSATTRLSIGRHQQPSKSATHVKTLPRMTKPPLNSYIADPGNDLDIEIGRIVNNTPYRVKVKMVPGEVGRYWFGDRNPKMAYCRVLKSKMVMVRVGGGWTELSQFLRDHALLEGDFIPKLADTIPEEEPAIQEGFIETRRANPIGRSHSPLQPIVGTPSNSASTSGYKDGDKFITTDENGNQLEVKMRRFSNGEGNDYTRRRMARKKEKLSKENTDSVNTQKP